MRRFARKLVYGLCMGTVVTILVWSAVLAQVRTVPRRQPRIEARARVATRAKLVLQRVVAAVSDVVEIDQLQFHAPDIVVDEIEFVPNTYIPPQVVTVRVTIRNQGLGHAGAFHVRWKPYATHPGIVKYVSGRGALKSGPGVIGVGPGAAKSYASRPGIVKFVSDVGVKQLQLGAAGDISPGTTKPPPPPGLDPGDTVIKQWSYEFTSKTEETFVEVDCYDEIAERREINNIAQGHPLIGAAGWDFYVQDIWLYKPGTSPAEPQLQPIGGEDVQVGFRVGFVNTVNNEACSVKVKMYVDGMERHSWPLTIPRNATRARGFTLNIGNGTHAIRISTEEPLEEANTANNLLMKNFAWRGRPQRPYKFEYYAIKRYDLIGGGKNLKWSINEGRKFYWRMAAYGESCNYWAEDAGVQFNDWAGTNARVNWTDIVYFAGHGNSNGPWYSGRGDSGGVLQMQPNNYRWGKNTSGQPTLRWCVWSACNTLYDGVQDSSHVNWGSGSLALSRWFQVFRGLHSIMGMRSLGWQGEWVQYEDAWWYWHDTRDRAKYFVNMVHAGYTLHHAWFMANRKTVWKHLDRGFEAAVLSACAEGTNYGSETFLAPYPDYVGTPTGYNYQWYRIGSPSY